jgi:hypothetical protein
MNIIKTYYPEAIVIYNADYPGYFLIRIEKRPNGQHLFIGNEFPIHVNGEVVDFFKFIDWFRNNKNIKMEVDEDPDKYNEIVGIRFFLKG